MYVEDGRILTSVFAESPNGAAGLCHETDAMCDSNKLTLAATASVCVSRETERSLRDADRLRHMPGAAGLLGRRSGGCYTRP